MKVLIFNDTDKTWKRHIAGCGPEEILPHTGATIDIYYADGGGVFVKVWNGVFLVRDAGDLGFVADVGRAIGAELA